jgi:hypothetical protein
MAIKIEKPKKDVVDEKKPNPNDRVPLYWDVKDGPNGIHAVNCKTGRVYDGPPQGFWKIFE